MKTLRAIWRNSEPFSLGNLLTFRMELELLARSCHAEQVLIFFKEPIENIRSKVPYFDDSLHSAISLDPIFSEKFPEIYDWPPRDSEMGQYSYGSLKRVTFLAEKTRTTPALSWPFSIESAARSCYASLKKQKSLLFAVHLKRQKGGTEESNADLEQWGSFFEEHRDHQFLILGKDEMPSWFLEIPNVLSSKGLGINLPTELMLCHLVDGFMGMASGICSAAIFSLTPYIIFKHPLHHAEEMKFEMGLQNHFPFSQKNQQLWREIDHIMNLRRAFRVLTEKESICV